jgi:hypothetical protein
MRRHLQSNEAVREKNESGHGCVCDQEEIYKASETVIFSLLILENIWEILQPTFSNIFSHFCKETFVSKTIKRPLWEWSLRLEIQTVDWMKKEKFCAEVKMQLYLSNNMSPEK